MNNSFHSSPLEKGVPVGLWRYTAESDRLPLFGPIACPRVVGASTTTTAAGETQLPEQNNVAASKAQPVEQNDVAGPVGVPFIDRSILNSHFSYAIDLGDGRCTRLVPANAIPVLTGLVREEKVQDGLILLPPPRAPSPRSLLWEGLDRQVGQVPLHPAVKIVEMESANSVQVSKADDAMVLRGKSSGGGQRQLMDNISSQVDARNGNPSLRGKTKRPGGKVYCDKWLHTGTCAFEQQGCLYLHLMPADPAVQRELGLNGLPNWYKYQMRGENQEAEFSGSRGPHEESRGINALWR